MLASTVVTRTAAGSAELAAPAHGLSLAQRRFLTLLDTACSVEELAGRQRADPVKVERDLARLASLGLVLYEAPAANDADDLTAANDDDAAPLKTARTGDAGDIAFDAVRLGSPDTSRRLRYVLVSLAAIMAVVTWQWIEWPRAPAPAPVPAPRPSTQTPVPEAPREPDAIATKVLVHATIHGGVATPVDVAFKRD